MLVFVHQIKTHQDVNDNQVSRGKDPSANLWGYYIPREHKRYGVYRIDVKQYSPEQKKYYPRNTIKH